MRWDIPTGEIAAVDMFFLIRGATISRRGESLLEKRRNDKKARGLLTNECNTEYKSAVYRAKCLILKSIAIGNKP